MMKKNLSIFVTVFTSLALPATAEAAIINGDFENGLNNWQTLGDSRIENLQGNSQAFLSTAFNEVIGINQNGQEIRGGNAAPATFISGIANNYLELFLNTSQFFGENLLAEAIEGSAIKQTFTASAGETITFDWNFLTNESVGDNANPNFNDFAFVTLSNNSQNLFFQLTDTTTQSFSDSSNPNFFAETRFQSFAYTLPNAGEYTLGIGIVDVGEPTVVSALLVDRVRSSSQSVPEVSSIASLLFLGTVGAVSTWKRRQKR